MTATQRPDEDRLDRVERILAEMAVAQAKAATAQAEANAAHQTKMADLEDLVARIGERVDRLAEQQQRTNQEMSTIKGWQTELTVERKAGDVFARLSSNGDLFRIYPRPDLKHYIGYGTRAGFVFRAEAEKIQAVDFLMEGSDGDGSPIMFAVEVSYAAGDSDIQRAVERAPLAAKLLGRQVLPAVAAEVITTDFEEKAQRSGIRWTYVPNGNSLMQ